MPKARSRSGGWKHVMVVLAAVGAGVCSPVAAQAQTQLPGITVTTPSPVAPGAISRAPATAPQQTAPAPDLAGTGLQISPDQNFVATTVVTPQQLLSQPSSTLGDALAARPGIAATTFAPGASRPVIRGLSGFRVRIQENGLSTGDVSALSDDHAVPIDPLAAGQVEVVRGPATLRYGSQAIGGVVNAVNNRIPTAIPANGILVETRGGFSTVDDGRNGAAIVEAGAGNFVIHADTFARCGQRLRHPHRRGAGQHQPRERGLLARRLLRVQGRLRRHRLLLVRPAPYYIPGIEAAEQQEPHRPQPVEMGQQGRVARQRLRPRGRPLLVRRHRLQARRGRIRCRSPSSARPFSRSSTRRAWRCSISPS